tara:strand:+ start:331 stop:456 length:126 start_codon:yes stop_codon:yes gene_type:complete
MIHKSILTTQNLGFLMFWGALALLMVFNQKEIKKYQRNNRK